VSEVPTWWVILISIALWAAIVGAIVLVL